MKHRLCPRYLCVLLPPYVHQVTSYALRNNNDFYQPKIRKGYLLNSFLWTAVGEWNRLDNDVRQSPTLASFKKALKQSMFYQINALYNFGVATGATNHARLRMGLSALNAHRKRYNFIQNNKCQHCGQKPEDEVHFLWKCPLFANQRIGLVGNIARITQSANLTHFILPPVTKIDFKDLTDLLLYRSYDLSDDLNIYVFTAVHEYIVSTKRFS